MNIYLKYGKANLYRVGDLRLIPGINEVRKEIWEKVKAIPAVVKRLELGLIIECDKSGTPLKPVAPKVDTPKPMSKIRKAIEAVSDKEQKPNIGKQVLDTEEPKTVTKSTDEYMLKDMNVKDAVAIVQVTDDMDSLELWMTLETRKMVLREIEARIATLKG